METLSCHGNQSAYATAIKYNSFVEANAMNISAKFQLYPPYSFWGVDFLFFSTNLAFLLPWQPIKLRGLDKKYMFGRGPLNKNFRQSICNEKAINSNFHFTHYMSMEI